MADRPPARRAGLYMRISRDQTGEGLGVERQQEDCRSLAERLGWEVADVYIDNDISATSGKARPKYKKMLQDLENGTIDAIIAWHPDRLYRRAADLQDLADAVQRNKTPVATVQAGNVDLSSPTGLLFAEMLGAFGMYEVRHKAERWTRSWQQRRESGMRLRTGTRMFGYDEEGNVLDHEAAVARVMAAKIREGGSILGVCRWLDEQGVVATRGSAWTPQSVKRYLTNPRLAGWSTLNGEVVAEGRWEPILDRDTFETVRAMLTARTRAHIPRKALLLGLIYCGTCGHRLITSAARDKTRNYRCPKRPGMNGCGRISGKAEPIEEVVEAWAKHRLDDPRVRDAINQLSTHPTEVLAEANALELRILELEAQLDAPGVPVDAIIRAISRAKDRRAELDGILASSVATPLPTRAGSWPDDLQRRRALIDLVVERVELQPADPTWGSGRGLDARRLRITGRR